MSISILREMRHNSFNLFTRAGIFANGKAPLSPDLRNKNIWFDRFMLPKQL